MAMRRHWDRAKFQNFPHGEIAFNLATGKRVILACDHSTFDELEPAYRFGYGAYIEYGDAYPQWNDDLELRLVKDWWAMNPERDKTWAHDREAIRYGWEFEQNEAARCQEKGKWQCN